MEKFQVIQPSAALSPYVKRYWFMTVSSDRQTVERIIPTGMICLIFHRGVRTFSSSENRLQPRVFISGLGTGYTDLSYSGSVNMISVEFRPMGARAFFNMPMMEFHERSVSVDDLSDPQLVELKNRLFEATDTNTCTALIENFLYKRFCQPKAHNMRRINAAMQTIYGGEQNVEALAQAACLSYKQFKRVFADYVGANPKDYLRIVRFQKSLHTLQTLPNVGFAQLACECGYFDQAHLIKEFKTFSGYTPSEYLAACAPVSDYFS